MPRNLEGNLPTQWSEILPGIAEASAEKSSADYTAKNSLADLFEIARFMA